MINIKRHRDGFLTKFGTETLKDRYLLPSERPQDMFARVSLAYSDDAAHAQRLYDYMSKLWFMPATPILANAGTNRGMPISCFLQNVQDDIGDIIENWKETAWLSCKGGGIGLYYGNVRSMGERVGVVGETSGIIPFLKVNDSLALAISQGSLRRGSAAAYLPVWHPEIYEFLDTRRPAGGDPNRKALNLHNAVCVDDTFMLAVKDGTPYSLISPDTGMPLKEVDARQLWAKILTTRLETGEPYILFIDRVRESTPEWHLKAGLIPEQSNLCSEITLPTNKERTAVCCLSSVNFEFWDEWSKNPMFIEDIMRFLDNVLSFFVKYAPQDMAKAIYSASQERSVGLGTMGFHSYLQKLNVPIDSVMAKSHNTAMFKYLKESVDKASQVLADERGACPDAERYGFDERFSYKMAIAPNASISIIAGNTSPGIEPYPANVYMHKTLSGSFTVKNKNLINLLESKGLNKSKIWESIIQHEGSVQHLEELTQEEKDVYRTAYEIDQSWLVELAAQRQPFIDQAQSLNIFLPSNIDKRSLHNLHFSAWEKGVKSMYYLRSKSVRRAEKIKLSYSNEDECIACN